MGRQLFDEIAQGSPKILSAAPQAVMEKQTKVPVASRLGEQITAIAIYCAVGPALIFLNRHLMVEKHFKYPASLTAVGLLACWIFSHVAVFSGYYTGMKYNFCITAIVVLGPLLFGLLSLFGAGTTRSSTGRRWTQSFILRESCQLASARLAPSSPAISVGQQLGEGEG